VPQAPPAPQIQTAGVTVASPVIVQVDPALGGSLATADGQLSVLVPPGASPDLLTLTLMPVDPTSAAANLLVVSQAYALTIVNSDGVPVVSFDQPLTLSVIPTPGSDPGMIGLSILDPSVGAFIPLETQFNTDGTVSAAFTSLAPPAGTTSSESESQTPG
jgi:hypothetical protein